MADKKNDQKNDTDVEVVKPSEVQEEAQAIVKETNSDVEKAGDEAAERLGNARKESFNVTDAVLGEDEDHGFNVRKAQAQTMGLEYTREQYENEGKVTVTPAPSQNQNNLIHPEDEVSTHPHAARNYFGRVI